MRDHLGVIKEKVVAGKHTEIEELVREALEEGVDFNQIINDALITAMDVIGERFMSGEIFVPEMLVSAVTMKKGLGIIRPLLEEAKTEPKGVILMATVKGDLHDIGKNLVIMMLEGAGFDVMDLGTDTSVEKVVEEVKRVGPDILGLSALLTTTMPEMENVIKALETNELRDSVKVMVGGAPLDARFAEEIGADGYGEDAAEAVKLARSFV